MLKQKGQQQFHVPVLLTDVVVVLVTSIYLPFLIKRTII